MWILLFEIRHGSERRKNILVRDCSVKNNKQVENINFSNVLKLLRPTASMKRFIEKSRKFLMNDGPLFGTEKKTEIFWIQEFRSNF